MGKRKRVRKILLNVGLLVVLSLLLAACGGGNANNGGASGSDHTFVLADAGWESVRVHNFVAATILEEGYGYKTDVMPGSTPSTFQGLINGDIDIYMELWTGNLETYYDEVEEGSILELSVNFNDNEQGLYVPTYMIEGDPDRGIEASTPNLASVTDLPQYWEVFKDPEVPSKGRIYGSIPGWAADEMLLEAFESYGLDETYNYFSPGSDAALATSLVNAYEQGEAWVGYYWSPTWVTGKYDLTLLEMGDVFPPMDITVAVHPSVAEIAPEVVEFLKNYETSSALTSAALAYMEDNGATEEEAAKWFMKEYEDVWTEWVPEDIATKVKAAL